MPPDEKPEETPADKTEDGGMKIEESAGIELKAGEPIVEIPVPMPEPTPVPLPELIPVPETPTELVPEPVIETPVVVDTPPIAPTPVPTPPIAPVAQTLHDPKYTKDIPQKILELTPEEINAARLLWARENIAAAQAQGNRNRRARMFKRMDEIEAIIKVKPQTTTHVIATKMNLSDKTTSSYLQKLVHAGRVQASGNSSNRRYSA